MNPFSAVRSNKAPKLWTPLEFGDRLRALLDASNTASISLNGTTKVSQWADSGIYGQNVGQPTASVQPTHDPTNKTIFFNNNAGGSQYLYRNTSTNELGWTGNQTCTIAIGFKNRVSTSGRIVGGFYTGYQPNNDLKSLQIGISYNSTSLLYTPYMSARSSSRSSTYTFSGTSEANLIVIAEYSTNFNNAATKITINGTSVTAASGTNNALNFNSTLSDPYQFTLIVGGGKDESNNTTLRSGFYGDIRFFACITGNLTTAENEKLTGWAAHNWNLSDLLPSNHTYKNSAPYA